MEIISNTASCCLDSMEKEIIPGHFIILVKYLGIILIFRDGIHHSNFPSTLSHKSDRFNYVSHKSKR